MTGWQQQIDNSISEPAEIHNLPNGQFPQSVLSDIHDHTGAWVGQLCHTAARAWTALVAAAWTEAGLYISPRSPGSSPSASYRSLPEQEGLWDSNYDHIDHGRGGRTCNGDFRYLKTGLNVCACPGTSNHGRGLAVDANVEVAGVLTWLENNARRFGFQWEIASESWHVHYFPGDTIPQAVLDFEHTGAAPLPTGDDEMPTLYVLVADQNYGGVQYSAGQVWIVAPGKRHYVASSSEYANLVGQWGQPKGINPTAWAYIVENTALDELGERRIPPQQFDDLVAAVAAAVKKVG